MNTKEAHGKKSLGGHAKYSKNKEHSKSLPIEEALNLFKWRMKSGGWHPNDNDKKAYALIETFIQKTLSKTTFISFAEESVFKIYVLLFRMYVEKHKSLDTALIATEMHKYLNLPLGYSIQQLTSTLNNRSDENLFKSIGISKPNSTLTKIEEDLSTDKLLSLFNQSTNKAILAFSPWKEEEVHKEMRLQFNCFLKLIGYEQV